MAELGYPIGTGGVPQGVRSNGDVVIVGTRRQKPFTKFPWEWSGVASALEDGGRGDGVRNSGGQGTSMPRVGDRELVAALESQKADHVSHSRVE